MVIKWADHKADIVRMVEEDMTDAEIGLVFNRTGAAIYQVRKRLGIPTKFKREPKSFRQVFDAQEPLAGETYIDEAGLTVKKCPARYAAGALIQTVTARPRRGN